MLLLLLLLMGNIYGPKKRIHADALSVKRLLNSIHLLGENRNREAITTPTNPTYGPKNGIRSSSVVVWDFLLGFDPLLPPYSYAYLYGRATHTVARYSGYRRFFVY